MKTWTATLVVCTALAAAHLSSCDARAALPWQVHEAQERVELKRAENSPWPADTAYVELWPDVGPDGEVQVLVFAADGEPVGSEVIWSARGAPVKVLFDCSSGSPVYLAYVAGKDIGRSPAWQPRAGVVMETRARGEGDAETWEQACELYLSSGPVLGRSPVPNIFHGVHPHGPTYDFLAGYRGYFDVEKPGRYDFATLSDDASFLLIDSKLVAEWPGWHDTKGGHRGQYNGSATLDRGRHQITYYNVQNTYGFCVEAAWKPPGTKHYEVIPAQAFAPLARYEVSNVEATPGTPTVWFKSVPKRYSRADELALVNMRFTVIGAGKENTYRWHFDDGLRASGTAATHVFPATGMRSVDLEVHREGKPALRVKREVHVRPDWTNPRQWSPEIYARQKEDILARDLTRMPLDDIVLLVRLADRIGDHELSASLGQVCLDRREEFSAANADVFHTLGMHFQHAAVRRYDLVAVMFRAGLAAADPGSKIDTDLRLGLAGYLVHCLEQFEEALAVLDEIKEVGLSTNHARLRTIFRADALVAQGHLSAARKLYQSVGTVTGPENVDGAARRRVRLETAGDYLRRGEYEAAERTIRLTEWETPLERLGTETGLVMIRLQIGRGEYPFAFAHCRRLLQAVPHDAHRAEILFHLVEVCAAMDRPVPAAEAFQKLAREYPYSEAAARARERWKEGPVGKKAGT